MTSDDVPLAKKVSSLKYVFDSSIQAASFQTWSLEFTVVRRQRLSVHEPSVGGDEPRCKMTRDQTLVDIFGVFPRGEKSASLWVLFDGEKSVLGKVFSETMELKILQKKF